jgi:hypothetical protein
MANGDAQSVDLRKACCALRKLEPMAAPAAGRSAWVTGLRREQSETAADVPFYEAGRRRPREVLPAGRLERGRRVALRAGGTTCPTTTCTTSGSPASAAQPCTRAVSAGEDPAPAAGGGNRARPRNAACTAGPRPVLGLRQESDMGQVIFIGAGPGQRRPHHPARGAAPGQADVVLFDALTDPALRELAPQARWVDVGKRGFRPRHRAGGDRRAAGASWHSSMRWWCG